MGIRDHSFSKEQSGSGTAARGVGGSPSLGVSQSRGDVALRDVGSGHGLLQGLGILVLFSNLIDSMEGLGGKHSPSH